MRPIDEQDRKRVIKARIDELMAAASNNTSGNSSSSKEVMEKFEFSSDTDKDMMMEVEKKIVDWISSSSLSCSSDNISATLEIPMESAFTRLLAHSYISHKFPLLYSNSVKRGDQRVLCVYQNKADLQKEQLAALERELEIIDKQIGARSLFDLISSRKIPLVGHNCFYDLLHTQQSFYEDVPPHVEQFKAKWMTKFSRTFDTKFLAECNEVLGGLHPPATLKGLCDFMIGDKEKLKGMVTIDSLSPEFQYSLPSSVAEDDHSHDAGYDAMMTSLVFIMQLRHIMDRKRLKWDMIEWKGGNMGSRGGTLSNQLKVPVQEVLRQCVNKIRLVKTQPSVINLAERQ